MLMRIVARMGSLGRLRRVSDDHGGLLAALSLSGKVDLDKRDACGSRRCITLRWREIR